MIDDFCTWGVAVGWRPRTIAQRRYQLTAFAQWAGLMDPIAASEGECQGWVTRPTLGPTAAATYLDTLRAYFRWAQRTGRRTDNPCDNIDSPRRRRGIPRPAPAGAIRDGIGSATGDLRTWIMLGYYAGLRCAEIADLHGEDVTAAALFVRDGKGGRQAMLPLHPALRTALARYPTSGELWPDNYKRISRLVSEHFARIGHAGVTAHRLRHSFGTDVYRASGRDLRMTQELLRHASPATTAIYTQVDPEESASVVGQLTA